MHTDEYEISLSRELAVCTAAIRKLQRSLAGPDDRSDRELQQQALRSWTERKEQYEALLRTMRISAS